MNPTDILLSIAIVGIYMIIYVYLKSKYDDNKTITTTTTINYISAQGQTISYLKIEMSDFRTLDMWFGNWDP